MKRFASLIFAGLLIGLTALLVWSQVPASFLRSGFVIGNSSAQSGGVIGVANFSLAGGTVNKLHVGGVISGITRNSTGRFTVTLSPAQTNFSVSLLAAAADGSGASWWMDPATDFSASTSSFDCLILNLSGGSFLDSPQIAIIVAQM